MCRVFALLLFVCVFCGESQQSVSDEIEALKRRMDACEADTHELKLKLENNTVNKRAVGVHVAFSTLLSYNQYNIAIGQRIMFDKVLLNDGSGYSSVTGTFTVPISGVYLFAYNFAHIYHFGQVWLKLMKNGQRINSAVSDALHDYQDIQGGNVAIIRAVSGDEIWLEAWHQNEASLYGVQGFTAFSGVLLY